ncbi:hypothetical protein NJ76_14525 [Rhodococcus sp. IITR03]|nr:hypothetical protein NJ76_14525 [Rhodococcus sp. IITR03]
MIRLRTTLAAGAGLALLLTGCSDDTSTDSAATSSAPRPSPTGSPPPTRANCRSARRWRSRLVHLQRLG